MSSRDDEDRVSNINSVENNYIHDVIGNKNDTITGSSIISLNKFIYDKSNELYIDNFHESFLFPEDSDETVTFTSGLNNNEFSAWTEIVDNNTVTFSSKITSDVHISSVLVESTSIKDVIYIYEISYGDSKIIIARARLLSGTNQVSSEHQTRVRNLEIPAGEIVYYRMKCATGNNTITLSLRYHLH